MMFVIQRIREGYESRLQKWERDRDEWVDDNRFHYRSDYEKEHPKPFRWLKRLAVVLGVVFITFLFIASLIEKHNGSGKVTGSPDVVLKNGDKCGRYRLNDIAMVKTGDYTDAEVEIIGGCKANESYEVKVTRDQILFGAESSLPGKKDLPILKDFVFRVNNSDNLIIIGHRNE